MTFGSLNHFISWRPNGSEHDADLLRADGCGLGDVVD